MTGILEWLPALATIMASIAGILVGLDQLTSGARLRKKATFWEEQLASPKPSHDTAVIRSLQREATARLAALEGYPGSKVLTAFYGILFSPFLSGFAATQLAILHRENRFDAEQIILHLFLFILAVLVFTGGIVNLARITVGRRLLVQRYLDGCDLSHRPRLPGAETSFRSTEGWQEIAFSLFVNLMAAFVGVWLAYPGLQEAVSSSPLWLRVPLPMLTFLVLSFGVKGMERLFKGGELVWEHPRELPEAVPQHERATRMEKDKPLTDLGAS